MLEIFVAASEKCLAVQEERCDGLDKIIICAEERFLLPERDFS